MLQQVLSFFRTPWLDKIYRIHSFLVRLKTAIYYRSIFAKIGHGSLIYKPLLLSGTQYVHVGDHTLIRQGVRMEAIRLDSRHPPRIQIGSNVNIEQNVHIVSTSSISIGSNVTIAGNCSIVDTVHPFNDVDNPVKIGARFDSKPRPVEIGDEAFIGIGCVILPGVRIGKYCIIGANSTVTCDIPDYSVAAGSPAKIQKRYDFEAKTWIKQNPDASSLIQKLDRKVR